MYTVMLLYGHTVPIYFKVHKGNFIKKAGNRWGIKISCITSWVTRIIISNSTSISKCLKMKDKMVIKNEEKGALFPT